MGDAISTGGDEPRWLDRDELRAWMALMQVLVALPAKLDAQLRSDSHLRLYEYHVLAALSDQPTRSIGMKALSVVTNGSMSRLSHVVSRLEGRGWVERRPHPTDGRLTEAHLTDEGFRTIADAAPAHVASARALVIDRLTPEQVSQLGAICESIGAGLDDGMSGLMADCGGGETGQVPPDR
ncbi:MarR family transcriptional regulator [Mycobacterium yunnanensis]|uniref:MarR family transcriptional regulator n=1 Tax=Mycobacterium yunnanensis TaxID=368477 RepID=A0A9X2Z447_9MYCO|nr:MarR family transcriptional regulator [Mycobacterium yunnanensis]MCV7422295.1 MarR family transcriptional regulator [Mycobacterium yunnanensis]